MYTTTTTATTTTIVTAVVTSATAVAMRGAAGAAPAAVQTGDACDRRATAVREGARDEDETGGAPAPGEDG